jgi:hypothetical protein
VKINLTRIVSYLLYLFVIGRFASNPLLSLIQPIHTLLNVLDQLKAATPILVVLAPPLHQTPHHLLDPQLDRLATLVLIVAEDLQRLDDLLVQRRRHRPMHLGLDVELERDLCHDLIVNNHYLNLYPD